MGFLLPSSSWLLKLSINSDEKIEASVSLSPSGRNLTVIRELRQPRRLRHRKRQLKVNTFAMMTILRFLLFVRILCC